MIASAPRARKVRPVSLSDSPFSMLEDLSGDQRGVRAQSLGGQLKAGAGAGGGLVKEQRDAALGQDAGAGERVLIFQSRGAGEEMAQGFEGQVLGREQRAGL
jgi:hypothetical protein